MGNAMIMPVGAIVLRHKCASPHAVSVLIPEGICRENPFLQKEKELLLSNTYDSAPAIHAKVKTNWDVFH